MDSFRIMKLFVVGAFVLFSILAQSYPLVPRQDLTTGRLCTARNPDFEGYRYTEKIPYCERNVTREQKEKIYNLYRIPVSCRGRYTIDHLIPLSIGGDNSDINLWPEHKLVKATRPQLEQELYVAISRGRITQKNAIELIVREKTKQRSHIISVQADACDKPSR